MRMVNANGACYLSIETKTFPARKAISGQRHLQARRGLMEKALTKRRSARRIVGSFVLTKLDGRTLMKLILLSIYMQEILLRWILNMC